MAPPPLPHFGLLRVDGAWAAARSVARAHAPVSRQTINQKRFVTHRAATRALPPFPRLRSVPSAFPACVLAIAQHVLTSVPYNRLPLLAKRHKVEVEKSGATPVELLQKQIARYDESGLCRLLLEVGLLESAYRNDGGDEDILLNTAKRYRIDAEKLHKAVAQEFAAKQKKKEKKSSPDKSAV
jgi:hypothetical protein